MKLYALYFFWIFILPACVALPCALIGMFIFWTTEINDAGWGVLRIIYGLVFCLGLGCTINEIMTRRKAKEEDKGNE